MGLKSSRKYHFYSFLIAGFSAFSPTNSRNFAGAPPLDPHRDSAPVLGLRLQVPQPRYACWSAPITRTGLASLAPPPPPPPPPPRIFTSFLYHCWCSFVFQWKLYNAYLLSVIVAIWNRGNACEHFNTVITPQSLYTAARASFKYLLSFS